MTAAFNLNLLVRANRELGADFDIAQWHHRAIYNREIGRIEMHLISAAPANRARWRRRISFLSGRKNHHGVFLQDTEEGFIALAATAGFRFSHVWTDPQKLFAVFHFVVAD